MLQNYINELEVGVLNHIKIWLISVLEARKIGIGKSSVQDMKEASTLCYWNVKK